MGYLTAHTTIRLLRSSAMPFPRGEYSPAVTDYRWDEERRDLVYYNGTWYAVKKYNPAGYVPAGKYPSASSGYWTAVPQFEIVITSMMVADAIRAGKLNVNGKFIVDTDGTLHATGAHITGEVTATSGSFTGSVNASSGTMNNVTVSNISSKNGNFSIDSSGNATVKNITSTGGKFRQAYVEGNIVTHNDGDMLFQAPNPYGGTMEVYGLCIGSNTNALILSDGTYAKFKGYTGLMTIEHEGGVITGQDGMALVNIAGITFTFAGYEDVSGFTEWFNSL